MKIFLSIASILAWLIGATLLFAPAAFYAPLHLVMTPLMATVAEAHGATLFGLGVISWMARSMTRKELQPILMGSLVVQVLSLGVAVHTYMLAGAGAFSAMVTHIILGIFFAYFACRPVKNA